MNLSYNGYYGVQEVTSLPDLADSELYTTLYNEAMVNSGGSPLYTDEDIEKYANGTDPLFPNIDYFDVYFGTASTQNHRLNVSGGSETLQYSFMTGYLEQEGVLVGTNHEKMDFRSNLDAYFFNDKKLRLTARLSGNRSETGEPVDMWATLWSGLVPPIWPIKMLKTNG